MNNKTTKISKSQAEKLVRQVKKNPKLLIVIAAVLIVACIISYFATGSIIPGAGQAATDSDPKFHFIDVGQGDCSLVTYNGQAVLIDAGPRSSGYSAAEYVWTYAETIDYFIITHPHEDHIGNADMVIDNFYVKNVIMPDVTTTTVCFEALLESIDDSGSRLIMAEQGDTYKVGGLSFKILGPAECDPENLNNCSIVLRADYGDVSMLFSGDAERSAELEVYERYADELDCDIFKVGHHGSSTSNCDEFITAASPDLALISCELGNS